MARRRFCQDSRIATTATLSSPHAMRAGNARGKHNALVSYSCPAFILASSLPCCLSAISALFLSSTCNLAICLHPLLRHLRYDCLAGCKQSYVQHDISNEDSNHDYDQKHLTCEGCTCNKNLGSGETCAYKCAVPGTMRNMVCKDGIASVEVKSAHATPDHESHCSYPKLYLASPAIHVLTDAPCFQNGNKCPNTRRRRRRL